MYLLWSLVSVLVAMGDGEWGVCSQRAKRMDPNGRRPSRLLPSTIHAHPCTVHTRTIFVCLRALDECACRCLSFCSWMDGW